MKNQQKTILALALSVMLFSCSNDEPIGTGTQASAKNLTYEVVAAAALPASASAYIASNYVGATTTEVNLNSNGTYAVYISNTSSATAKSTTAAVNITSLIKLNFTVKGAFISAKTQTMIAIANLLPAITTYISTNYASAVINAAHVESDGSFDVLLTATDGSKVKLNFKPDGTFVSAKALKANGNHKHNHSNGHNPVAIADLVDAIKTYITTNYTGATITSAHKESDGSFDVFITTASGAKLNINFSASGDFVSVSSDDIHHSDNGTVIAISSLSATITTYISTNYAGATIVTAKQETDGNVEVYILTATGIKLELKFNASGNFVALSSNSNNHFPSNEAPVVLTNLLANIKTYITTNYMGATIKEAHVESDGTFDVVITTSSGVQIKLNFSATGAFLRIKN
ncbi:MAG: hypothetical protein RLZZ323_1442 [Bacteroidota bacterium]|jgi:hypothetical protein